MPASCCLHAWGERQYGELVTGVPRERNVERLLAPVVRFLPARVYRKFATPSFESRVTGSLPLRRRSHDGTMVAFFAIQFTTFIPFGSGEWSAASQRIVE